MVNEHSSVNFENGKLHEVVFCEKFCCYFEWGSKKAFGLVVKILPALSVKSNL